MNNDNITKFYLGYNKILTSVNNNSAQPFSGDVLDYFDKNDSEENYFLFYVVHRLHSILDKHGYRKKDNFSDYFGINPNIDEVFHNLLNKVSKRNLKVLDNCVLIDDIISINLSDTIYSGVIEMNKHKINSLIILNDGKVVGLFSERSLLDEYINKGEVFLNHEVTFQDVEEHLNIEAIKTAVFIDKGMTQEQLKKFHSKSLASGTFVDFYFVTEDGTKDTRLLGMLTPSRFLEF